MEGEIELLCPSLSKQIQVVAGDVQKPDLGSIARAFGLDPNTLKLNGYFISRGPDLIASSLTWHSLIAFFSSRALPTGAASSAPILVHGKIASKTDDGRQRWCVTCSANDYRPIMRGSRDGEEDAANAIDSTRGMGLCRDSKRAQHQHCSSMGFTGSPKSSDLCLKRKLWLEDESHPKRARTDDGRFSCGIINRNLKRMRIDEIVASTPSKKLR